MNQEDKIKAYITSKQLLFRIDKLSDLDGIQVKFGRRLESRTRHEDLTDALRFRVHDPLWLLARQWQLGEFRGNNAGTALNVKCRINRRKTSADRYSNDEIPIEPEVESMNHDLTPLVRVEAAMYFLDMLQSRFPQMNRVGVQQALRNLFPLGDLKNSFGNSSLNEKDIKGNSGAKDREAVKKVENHTRALNTRLGVFSNTFVSKFFDGIQVRECVLKQEGQRIFDAIKHCFKLCNDFNEQTLYSEVVLAFFDWTQNTYFPRNNKDRTYWNNNQLGYDCEMDVGKKVFESKDYSSGQLSWYSFDVGSKESMRLNDAVETEHISAIPSLASYPGAPSKRLWEFEDNKVFLGNAVGMQAKGNIAMMQYATMYGNDWMLIPLTTHLGTYTTVERIVVTDSFGLIKTIRNVSGKLDDEPGSFGQRWQMYGNVRKGPRKTTDDGLFFPPALNHIMEGKPVEEVQLLRDEMANMVWGVETSASDGCGGNIDLNQEAAQVQAFIDEQTAGNKQSAARQNTSGNGASQQKPDYAYVLQTQVPLNWIPFVPQHPKKPEQNYDPFHLGGRDIVLRRGKMPCFFGSQIMPVRPRTQFLAQGLDPQTSTNGKVKETPLFINEEEVQQVGTRIVKNYQRARWINGQTFNWLGYQTQIKGMQGNSGLTFDALIDVNVQKKDA